MPVRKLKEFLDSQNIKYVAISHSKAYTAQGIAALTHISGKELAKTVIVKLDDALAMVVLPASGQVDLSLLKAATGKEIAFNAGTHSELIRLSWEDFVRLVKPRVLKFSSARTGTTAA